MDTKRERLHVDELIELDGENCDGIAADHLAELDRRLDLYEADGNRGRDAGEAIAEIRRKL